MANGWVAMNSDGSWTWWKRKPKLDKEGHWFLKWKEGEFGSDICHRVNIDENVGDYRKSLRRYGDE